MSLTARERISKAIIFLLDAFPFYADLLLRGRLLPMSAAMLAKNPTMAVDAEGNVYFCEEFVQSLSDAELRFVLLHEAKHKAQLHVVRGAGRDHDRWNVAIDIVTDWSLVHQDIPSARVEVRPPVDRIVANRDGTISIPGWVIPPGVGALSAEEVYAAIAPIDAQPAGGTPGDGGGSGGDEGGSSPLGRAIDGHEYAMGDGTALSSLDDAGLEALAEQQRDDIVEAATRCKQRGSLPADVERMLDRLLAARVDWRQYLWRFITRDLPFDVSLSRPNRRFIGQGLALPGVLRESLDVVVFVDLSGSISDEERDAFLSECVGIASCVPNVRMTLVSHDAQVTAVHELGVASEEQIVGARLVGGGGTDHRPCFSWVEEHAPAAQVLVFFTDGLSVFPKDAPTGRHCLWLLSGGGSSVAERIPFGVVVQMDGSRG